MSTALQPAAVVNENAGNSVDVDDDDDDDLDGAPISAHELPSEFDALDDRQLRIKCRTMGVPEGERKDMLMRLKIATIVASQVTVATTAIAMQPPPQQHHQRQQQLLMMTMMILMECLFERANHFLAVCFGKIGDVKANPLVNFVDRHFVAEIVDKVTARIDQAG
jgi:hypothetical protein